MNDTEIDNNLSKNIMKYATDAERTEALCNVVRRLFEHKDAIERAAQVIAEREIQPVSRWIYITVENISLDDDPDFPTIIIMARENWQGNCVDHTLALPLAEFVPTYMEAMAA